MRLIVISQRELSQREVRWNRPDVWVRDAQKYFLRFFYKKGEDMDQEKLDRMRHSLAHIMASAVSSIWPEAQFGVGPTINDGFYYDIYLPSHAISESDFPLIESKMREIIKSDLVFERQEKTIEEALLWAKEANQPFKVELLDDIKNFGTTIAKKFDSDNSMPAADKSVTLYRLGDYVDLCRGPHLDSTSEVGAYKLTKVAGAYWRGDEEKQQMQRIYGVAFENEIKLDEYLSQMEEAKQRDHRKLGKELDLYTISPLVGSGLPLFTPRGTILRDLVSGFTNQLRQDFGFTKVWTPHITKKELYEKSGHWAKFGGELFLVKSQETSDQFVLKPMNCPHHAQIFSSRPRSYRDMPLRYLETTTDYRDEKTGELGGLNRVRALTQDDSHVFCKPDQIGQEIDNLIQVANSVYSTIGMKLRVRLSYRDDSDAYLGDRKLWNMSQEMLKTAVIRNKLDFFEQEGEAAFYGPKIDFMASDAIGREHQVATVQVDFVQPERFELKYIDQDGSEQQPVMIHCAILGSIERFLSVFIEHTAGWFPFWCAPEQVRILTVTDEVNDYVAKIEEKISAIILNEPVKFNQLRYWVDNRNESLGKKIREATNMKIPVQLIIGVRDRDAECVSVRTRDSEQKIALSELDKFIRSL